MAKKKVQHMKERAFRLMREWCDTLLQYKINTNNPYTNNALICPACHVIHGRIADLTFPLTVIWAKTGEEEYLRAADELIDWSEFNLKTQDGAWYNDITNRWFATTAFSALSIGDALYHYGQALPKAYSEKWRKIFERMADAALNFDSVEGFRPVSNYYCGIATMLAMAAILLSDSKYLEKSKVWLNEALLRFDAQGLLYGEGYPMEASDGSHTVDMGYNLEESIPLLLKYASLTGEYTELFRERMHAHLEFLLPDGAIDNSFGTRHNKWTYWGSRTSDGIISGLALMLDDAVAAEAAERALSLYEKCTYNGLLSMPMANTAYEPTCIHHTFAHAKALAALITAPDIQKEYHTELPAERDYGIKEYQNGRLLLLSNGKFRATYSASRAMLLDENAANGGGSMNLLYHSSYGVICAATSIKYIPSEPLNQQYLRNSGDPPCMTAQFIIDNVEAAKDKNVVLSHTGYTVTAKGSSWQAEYRFNGNTLEIILEAKVGIYNIPIVCKKESIACLSKDKRELDIDKKIHIKSDTPLIVDPEIRTFNQVGGLMYLPISAEVIGSAKITLSVS